MMRLLLVLAATLVTLPAGAQTSPQPKGSPHPTKVVAHSGRLVTARTSAGGTQSYNCKKPENARRAVCKR